MYCRSLIHNEKADIFSFAGPSAANEKNNKLCDLGVLSEVGDETFY
jgi:hypothetical protein